ncbi:helix-turn-helix domain-containing protein [Chitinophaga japonensis]|uniref:Helix-turn-helix protein n=1 Tax=Chitinophaga japonensis TaxID=104662 RepID=A0A562SSL4_CHIJA|nr:helix-turn-helix transcriptional regulator [Chitinophaga japonensis]TWI84269.1 helix-turn-helix protein [Chitinophaga japonensis]
MKSSDLKTLKANFDNALAFSSEEEAMQHQAHMLAFCFLSEVERYQQMQGLNRKMLAEKINTSASYITQLFRGDKLPNLEILAKMQKALNIQFQVTARPVKQDPPPSRPRSAKKAASSFPAKNRA